ncbi:MAG: ComF family protein [Mycobacteriales bacterium]
MLTALLDLVLPTSCAGCRLRPEQWCPECATRLRGPPRPARPRPCPPGLPDCWAVAGYGGPVRQAMLAYKERQRRALVEPLAEALAAATLSAASAAGWPGPATGLVLVPVPSRRAAARARGGDHLRRLADRAAARLPGARVAPVLRQVRRVADSAGLSAEARRVNLAGAFGVRRPPPPGVIVIVDDVITTGASLAEAARALAAAGHPAAGGAVIAATERKLTVSNS